MYNAFLDSWLKILRNCNYDNTYKMAWAKAITEISLESDYAGCNDNEEIEITLKQIAQKVIKYYWNQTIYFYLIQGSNPLKPPKILSITKGLIEVYQEAIHLFQPIRFERAQNDIESNLSLKEQYDAAIKDIIKVLKSDVSYRFLNLEGIKIEGIYNYKQNDNSLYISVENLKILKQNVQMLFETINYRWALILETFNSTPRICKKVKIIDDNQIRRKPLMRFMKYLDMDNPDHICFVCGKRIEADLSIDHVIPWSYLYSDDLWNLVYAHKGCNSTKSNIVPDEEIIKRLQQRNKSLLELIEVWKQDKVTKELRVAVEKDYVQKFWITCQG